MDFNAIERVGMTNRIYQIQQRIANIQEQFQVDKIKPDVNADRVNADFQSRLDKEIERQDKLDAAKDTSENKDKPAQNLPVSEEEIINAAKVIVALASGNAAAPNFVTPSPVEKNQTEDTQNKNHSSHQGEGSTTEDLLNTAAQRNGIDPALVRAVAIAESGMNQEEISPVGAIGVMQLMPETAESLGVDPYDEAQNIEGGTRYLRQMLDQFGGNVKNALAAYNAGPAAVKRYGGIPPYSETQNYVGRIMDIVSG